MAVVQSQHRQRAAIERGSRTHRVLRLPQSRLGLLDKLALGGTLGLPAALMIHSIQRPVPCEKQRRLLLLDRFQCRHPLPLRKQLTISGLA